MCIQYGFLSFGGGILPHAVCVKPGHTSWPRGGQSYAMLPHRISKQSSPTSGLRLPTLGIAGDEDGSTPPDLVRETVGLVPGSQFHLIRKAGHLPCVEQPEDYAAALTDFLRATGHIPGV